MLPTITQLGVVRDNNPAFTLAVQDTETAARKMNVSVRVVGRSNRDELDAAFADFSRMRVSALEFMPTPTALRERRRVAELALEVPHTDHLTQREYVEVGGLMSYGSHLGQMFQRAATYVDKILKGAKPADLPVQQPTKFELSSTSRLRRRSA